MSNSLPENARTGFWQRPLAILIDMVIIAMLGQLILVFSYQVLSESPGLSLAVGGSLAFIYFLLADSKLTQGQSPGKKLLRIRLIHPSESVSYPVAGVRSVLIIMPWIIYSIPDQWLITEYLKWSLLYGLLLIQVLLYLVSRQLLQDRLLNTAIVPEDYPGAPINARQSIVGDFMAVALIAAFACIPLVTSSNKSPTRLNMLQNALLKRDGVVDVQINQGRLTPGSEQTLLGIWIWQQGERELDQMYMESLYEFAGENYAGLSQLDGLFVELKTGVNLGITNSFRLQSNTYIPE